MHLKNGIQDEASIRWVSSDETVPAFSAAHDTPRDRLHYVCGISHVPLTTDPQTTRLMDDFVIRGEPMRDEQSECPYEAREVTTYARDLSDLAGASAGPRTTQVIAGGKTYALADAERAGVVQVLDYGAAKTIVSLAGKDVRIELPAGAPPAGPHREGREQAAPLRPLRERWRRGGARRLRRGDAGGKTLKPAKADTRPRRRGRG